MRSIDSKQTPGMVARVPQMHHNCHAICSSRVLRTHAPLYAGSRVYVDPPVYVNSRVYVNPRVYVDSRVYG